MGRESDRVKTASLVTQEQSFEHWSRMPFWSVREGVSLLLGEDPDEMTQGGDDARRDIRRLLELANRAVQTGRLTDPMPPAGFLHWARQSELEMPLKLAQLVETRQGHWTDWELIARQARKEEVHAAAGFDFYKRRSAKLEEAIIRLRGRIAELEAKAASGTASENSSALKKSLNTALKLVGGMAIAIYGFNPNDKRGTAISQIQNDLDLLGISLDADTIRKRVKEGAKLVMSAEFQDPKPK